MKHHYVMIDTDRYSLDLPPEACAQCESRVTYRCALCGHEEKLRDCEKHDNVGVLENVSVCPEGSRVVTGGISVWLDDERPEPEGWVRARTIEEVQKLLTYRKVARMSLDHDLGVFYDDGLERFVEHYTGYDLCLWMAEHGIWPETRPTVHSANPVGARNMKSVIDRYGPYDADGKKVR